MSKRRGVWRRVGRGLKRAAVWVAAVGAAVYVCGAWYLPSVVEGAMARVFPQAAVSVQGVRFSGLGVLVRGAAVAEDEERLATSPVFFAERVRLGFAPGELLRGRIAVRQARVQDAVVTAEFEAGRGWNVERFGVRAGDAPAGRLPAVRIERGALRVRRLVAGRAESIVTVGVDGQIGATDAAGAYAFSLRADERLALSGSRVDGTLRIGGDKSVLSLTGTVRMPRMQVLDNAWNLDDVVLECAFDGGGVDVHRLGFRMGEGAGVASGRLDFARAGGFDVSADLAGFVISDTPAVDTVVYADAAMELLGPWAEGFLRRYRPRGLGDVQLRLRGRWDALGQTEVTGKVVCRDITVTDARFPYDLRQMAGAIVFSGRSLTLESLVCRHGESEFVIDGVIEDFGPEMEIRMRVVSGNIRFDEDVYRALGPEAKRMWFAFSPSGTGAIDHTYQRYSDGRRMRRLAVDLIDAGAIYEYFPYPLEHLTGRIVFEPNGVTLSNVEAHYDDARSVRLDGTVSGPDDFSVRVRAEQIPVDGQLVRAMPEAQQAFMARFELEATASVDVEVTADGTGQRSFDYTGHLEAAARQLVYAGFAVPLEEVRIVADMTQETIELRELTGRYGDGRVLLRGQIAARGEDGTAPGLCLEVDSEGFVLDEAFWAAVEREVRHLPPGVRLAGPVDAKGRWLRNMPAACGTTDLAVVCRANPLTVDGQAAGRVSGLVRFEPGRVRLEDFRIEEIILDASLAGAMPERMRGAYERLDITGRADAAILTAVLTLDEEGLAGIEAMGRVNAEGVNSGTTDLIENLTGVIEGRIRLDADERIQDVEAVYRTTGFDLRGRHVDHLSGRLVYDPNEGVLASRNFSVELGQGKATGSATIDIANEASLLTYTLGLNFEGIAVDRLVASPESPVEAEPVQHGQAAGVLTMQGLIGRPETQEGRLSAAVSNMQLGKQSLIGKVLTAIQFREPKGYVFNRMEMEAFIMGDEAVIDRVRISGRPFVFHGQGRYNLRSNRIEMDLVALGSPAGLDVVILDSLLRGLGSAFWKIEIRGDLSEPEIRTVSLPILQLPLDLLWR